MKTIRVNNQQAKAQIILKEIEKPIVLHPNEVVVQVLCIGLDGTDREILTEHYGSPPEGETELTTGHESLGVVVEAGESSGFEAGDLVTALVRRPCNDQSCVNCRNGHADFCETGKYVERGIKGAHGYLSEFYKEEARFLIKVPSECLDYGMLAEPQSIVEKVWDQIQRVQQRLIWEPRTALILGSGPLGILAAITCRLLGLETYVWSMSPENGMQAQIIQQCGAHYQQATANTKEGRPASLTEYAASLDKRIDLIMECTGYSPLAFEGMSILGPNGVLALLGVTPGNRKLEVSADTLNMSMVLENKCVIGSVNASRKDFETGIYRLQQMSETYSKALKGIITGRITLEDVPYLDFAQIPIKTVVDVVPVSGWKAMVKETTKVEYSFSL